MAIIQVAQVGTKFAVQEDGNIIPGLSFDTRGQAIVAAISYKEVTAALWRIRSMTSSPPI